MRVALLTDGIWPYVNGGMQKHSYNLCKLLAQRGVHVDLFHPTGQTSHPAGLSIFTPEENSFIRPVVVAFPKSIQFPGHYLYNSYRYSVALYKALEPNLKDYDLIYAKGFTGWHLLEKKSRGRTKLPPVFVKLHGYEMFQKPPGFRARVQYALLLRRPAKKLTRLADFVFSYGGNITRLIENLGVKRERIIEMPAGIHKKEVADGIMATPDITRFLYLGRFERRKGVEEINAAIESLPDDIRRKAEFHFIGPIPDNKRIHAGIYHGEVRDRDYLMRLIRGCDVLLCPSWSEGMPNVILEAMAQGLCVIATNVGATPLLVNQQTGWLLAHPSVQEIRNAIVSAVNASRNEIDEKKHHALNLIQSKFVWDNIGDRLIAEIENAVQKTR